MFSKIHAFLTKDRDRAKEAQQRQDAAERFDLAPQGGFITVVKNALFCFFGYYNARLFLTTVPGFDGWLTAVFALAGEGTALYCIRNFTRSTGLHKLALGAAGAAFTLFSVTHAVFSFFRLEQNARTSNVVQFYCENIAFPVLFSMLVVTAITLPLCHWRARVAAEQAKTMEEIQRGEAKEIAESAAMRREARLERQKLEHLKERTQIEGEYLGELRSFVKLKREEREIVNSIPDPALRDQVARELGLETPPADDSWPRSAPGKM